MNNSGGLNIEPNVTLPPGKKSKRLNYKIIMSFILKNHRIYLVSVEIFFKWDLKSKVT